MSGQVIFCLEVVSWAEVVFAFRLVRPWVSVLRGGGVGGGRLLIWVCPQVALDGGR